ncbi:hypothetical protein HZS61_005437 [Fusarium oxysporum f. sp. conglutinans]|uniref:Uncharacterized protein n=1 Tax=Fusarium oxysporum f. sp. conglutinans TaxID=100902 RepID=A0A8H6GD90_FUSOX|nr:hypothetical protein HZS61_005437 [Fusarium oxysporum f. sp. conglutinans]
MPLSHHAQPLPNNAANRTGSTNVRPPTCRWRPGFSHWPRSRTDPYLPAGSCSKLGPALQLVPFFCLLLVWPPRTGLVFYATMTADLEPSLAVPPMAYLLALHTGPPRH